MAQGSRIVQYLVAFAVCLASVTAGVALTWTTPVLPKFRNNETDLMVTNEQMSWITSIGALGFMGGSLMTTYVADRLGRRTTVLGSAIPLFIGALFIAVFANVWLLYISRVVWGTGIGMIATVSTIYLAEIADKDIRGALTISSRFMFNLGNFLVMAVGPFVSYTTLNYMILPLPVIYFIACWFIPETPYYSLKVGKIDQARSALTKLRNYADDKELEDELALLRQDVMKETQRSGTIKELVTGARYRKALIICFGIKICQMLSGVIVIQHYFGLMIKESKATIDVGTASIVFGVVRFLSGIVSSLLTDRLGRRPLLIYSFLGSGLALGLTGAYFFCQEHLHINENVLAPYGIIAFIGIILSVIFSTLGFNSLIYLIPAELFPMNVKSVAMTWLNIFGGFSNFGIIKMYQFTRDWLGLFGVFTIYTIVCLAGGVFSYFVVPETKGKSLREILVLLQGNEDVDEAGVNLNKIVSEGEAEAGEETEMQAQDLNHEK